MEIRVDFPKYSAVLTEDGVKVVNAELLTEENVDTTFEVDDTVNVRPLQANDDVVDLDDEEDEPTVVHTEEELQNFRNQIKQNVLI